jgi:sugar-specific transcriptional regulator TrmB
MILSIKEDELEVFLNVGLTQNQAKIYLALLKLGMESNASSLFQISGVSRQDVYRVLEELERLGIVEIVVAKPNRFRAVSPKDAFSSLVGEKIVYFNELNNKAQSFAKEIMGKYGNPLHSFERDQIVIINEKHALLHKAQELIGKCQISVDSIVPDEFMKWVTSCSDSYTQAKINGVKIRWIIRKPRNKEIIKLIHAELTKNPHMEVRCCSEISVKVGIFDGKETVMAMFGDEEFAEGPTIWSNSPVIMNLAKAFFETEWKKGNKLEQRDAFKEKKESAKTRKS